MQLSELSTPIHPRQDTDWSQSSKTKLSLLQNMMHQLKKPNLKITITSFLLRTLDRRERFVPQTRTTMAMSRSFSIIGPSLWNRFPPSAHASFLSSNLSTSLSLPNPLNPSVPPCFGTITLASPAIFDHFIKT